MKNIVAIYTGQGLAEPLQDLLLKHLPEYRLTNIIDDGIIRDVIRCGEVTKPVIRRLIKYYQTADDMGADIILNTCSSVGEVVDIARNIIDAPILKIDEPMAKHAVENHQTIGVIATLPTTLDPTIRLIQSQAKLLDKDVSIVEGLAEGAYHALIAGKRQEHDDLILKIGQKLANQVDCIVLAQASMMRMQEVLQQGIGKAVLASPPLCVQWIKSMSEGSSL